MENNNSTKDINVRHKSNWEERFEAMCIHIGQFRQKDLMKYFMKVELQIAREEVVRDIHVIAHTVINENLQIENDGITILQRIHDYAKENNISFTNKP